MERRFFLLAAGSLIPGIALAGLGSRRAMYAGGTIPNLPPGAEGNLDVTGAEHARFSHDSGEILIPYKTIESLEYGQKAGRRVGVAIMVSPLALFSKKRKHYLTIGYTDAASQKQGVVLELGKNIIRNTLVNLQTKTGKEVEYESEEARKNVGS